MNIWLLCFSLIKNQKVYLNLSIYIYIGKCIKQVNNKNNEDPNMIEENIGIYYYNKSKTFFKKS